MKKLSILVAIFAAIALASCGDKKAKAESEESAKSFEQEQIEANIKMQFDSLAAEVGRLKLVPFLRSDGQGGFELTQDELKVKPDFLLNPSVAEDATTLAEKYRLLSALDIDRRVAKLYEMPLDDYNKAITKLAADINDPSFKDIDDKQGLSETTQDIYDKMEANGRLNYFWQMAAAALVEQLYLINQNPDKFLSTFTDEAASNVTFRIILINDALNRLSEYDPEIEPVADAINPLEVLNATSVDELKSQLAEVKEQINAARETLTK